MANKNQVYIDIIIDDNGTTKRVAMDADKLGIQLEKAAKSTEKGTKNTDKLSKSQKNLDRNMRGTAKMSGNTTKEFSKMSQGMGGLVGAYATLAAQVFAVSAAFQFLSSASDLRNLISGQEAMGAVTGTAYKSMTSNIISATDAQLKYADAARATAIGTAAGVTGKQLTSLAKIAKNASNALGRDLTDSFNRLVRGVTKAEPELLDELGIILRLETATEKYAEKLGKAKDDLTAFERTQAVANEVLEQGTQKFGAIEALMDPNAAALSKFTKSFDELVNTFKIGLINTLGPALEFLSKNTMAFSAALGLLALPVVKSILPAMDDWITSTEERMKVNDAAHKDYTDQLDIEKKKVEEAGKTQGELLEKRQAAAKGIIENKGGLKGKGQDYFTSMGGDGRTRVAAQRQINDALLDLDKEHYADRGDMAQKYNREEIQVFQDSLDTRSQTDEEFEARQKDLDKKKMTRWQKTTNATGRGWAKMSNGMAKASNLAAKGINKAMGAIVIIGFVIMMIEAFKALKNYLFPLSEEQQKFNDRIDESAEAYKVLNEELERSANARNTILTADQLIINRGNALASIDVTSLISDMTEVANFTGKSTDKWEEYSKGVEEAYNQLLELDGGFIRIQEDLRGLIPLLNREVGSDTAEAMHRLSSSVQEAGVRMGSLGTLSAATNTALLALGNAGTANTPLTNFVEKIKLEVTEYTQAMEDLKVALAGQEALFDMKSTDMSAFNTTVTDLEDAKTALKEFDKARTAPAYSPHIPFLDTGAGPEVGGNQTNLRLDLINKVTEAEEKNAAAKEKLAGFTEKQLKSLEATIARNPKIREDMQKELDIAVARDTKLSPLLVEEDALRDKLHTKKLKFSKKETQGLTLQGKINNIASKRNDLDAALAISAQKVFVAKTKIGTENEAQAGQATRNHKALEQEHELLEDKTRLERDSLNIKEETLKNELGITKLMEIQLDKSRQLFTAQRKLRNLKASSGGSRASRDAIRTETATVLQAQLIQDNADLEIARQKLQDQRMLVANRVGEDAEGDNKLQKLESAFTKGQIKRNTTQDNIDAVPRGRVATLDGNRAAIEDVTMESQKVFMFRQQKTFFELRAAFELQHGEASVQELATLKQQAVELNSMNELLENKQQIRESMASHFESAFDAIVSGSMSAKEAFKQMATSILADLARMILKALIMQALTSAFGAIMPKSMSAGAYEATPQGKAGFGVIPTPTPKMPSLPTRRYGGITEPKSYRAGGIASGRDAGYPAILHGTEAVVPVGMNKKIPVEMVGGNTGGTNNVVVNVSMDSSGGASTSSKQSSGDMGNLGNMIAQAVQDELQQQKRSGGILNPYGVA